MPPVLKCTACAGGVGNFERTTPKSLRCLRCIVKLVHFVPAVDKEGKSIPKRIALFVRAKCF